MKKIYALLIGIFFLGLIESAEAAIVDHGNNFYYDNDEDLTWYLDTSGYTWDQANGEWDLTSGISWYGANALANILTNFITGTWEIPHNDQLVDFLGTLYEQSFSPMDEWVGLLKGFFWSGLNGNTEISSVEWDSFLSLTVIVTRATDKPLLTGSDPTRYHQALLVASGNVAPVPLPGALIFLGFGLIGLAACCRRDQSSS
ncbi:MAG: PEP-CTERM sorting domain-containing protein [Desulfobacterales bacterium]|nr:PEP-CTERM sorting domain-containing protein [Desulfobacterales bacterium]